MSLDKIIAMLGAAQLDVDEFASTSCVVVYTDGTNMGVRKVGDDPAIVEIADYAQYLCSGGDQDPGEVSFDEAAAYLMTHPAPESLQ